jgi:hypothetical protein
MSIELPAMIRTTLKPVLMVLSLNVWATSENPTFVIRPMALIISASRIKTSLLFIFGINPEIAAEITIANEAVVAAGAEKLKMYIRIGTESIAPPVPTNPRTAPISTPLNIALAVITTAW